MRYALLLLFLIAPLGTAAFSIPSTDGVAVSANPEYPKPGQRVVITATPIGVSPDQAVFDWVVEGSRVTRELGARSITLSAPPLGTGLEVSVFVSIDGLSAGSATFILQSASVALIYEGVTSRIPFYIGRPEPNGHSAIVAVAIPTLVDTSGTLVDDRAVVYEWRIDGKVLQASSGVGRSVLRTSVPFYDSPFTLTVIASTKDGALSAAETVAVLPRAPELVLYMDSPLSGVETERAVVEELAFAEEEVAVRAFPLGVAAPHALIPEWSLNGSPFTIESESPWTAIFRKTGEGRGTYTVGLSFAHARNFLERIAHSFLLTF